MFDKYAYIEQPKYQYLMNGKEESNPFYDKEQNISYYTFRVKNESLKDYDHIYFAVGENISKYEILSVEERKSLKGEFHGVKYELISNSEALIQEEYKYLRVKPKKEVNASSIMEYRFIFRGYAIGKTSSKVKNMFLMTIKKKVMKFEGVNFIIPFYEKEKSLVVHRESQTYNLDDKTIFEYKTKIINNKSTPVNNIKMDDKIYYSSVGVEIGNITGSSEEFECNREVAGTLNFRNDFKNMAPYQVEEITIKMEINRFKYPGRYSFPWVIELHSDKSKQSFQNNFVIDVFEIKAINTCVVKDDRTGEFRLNIVNGENSPEGTIEIQDIIDVPQGVILELGDIGAFEVTGENGGKLYMGDKVGGARINLFCRRNMRGNSEIEMNIPFSVKKAEGKGIKYVTNDFHYKVVGESDSIYTGVKNQCSKSFFKIK